MLLTDQDTTPAADLPDEEGDPPEVVLSKLHRRRAS